MKTQKRQRPATTPPPLNFLHRTVSTDDSLEEETLPPSPGSQSAISLSSFRTVTRNGEPTSSDVYNMFQQILRMGSIEARLKATEDHAEALENFKKKQEDQIIALEEKCKELTLENIELSRLVASQKDEQIDRTKRLEKLENEVIPSVESRITSNTQLQNQLTTEQISLISRMNTLYNFR
jgi:chromosome segregation ATPase